MSPWAEEQWHFSAGIVVIASPVSASLTPHGVGFTMKPSGGGGDRGDYLSL